MDRAASFRVALPKLQSSSVWLALFLTGSVGTGSARVTFDEWTGECIVSYLSQQQQEKRWKPCEMVSRKKKDTLHSLAGSPSWNWISGRELARRAFLSDLFVFLCIQPHRLVCCNSNRKKIRWGERKLKTSIGECTFPGAPFFPPSAGRSYLCTGEKDEVCKGWTRTARYCGPPVRTHSAASSSFFESLFKIDPKKRISCINILPYLGFVRLCSFREMRIYPESYLYLTKPFLSSIM